MVYIGQSQNIEKRFKEHLWCLSRSTHANPKMQSVYNQQGTPELVILEACSIAELYDKEIVWTKEFDSLAKGLNIVEPGPSGWGTNSSRSKYSKIQILRIFSLLTTTNLANIDIAKKVGVNIRLVESIRGGYSHVWLKDAYPERYLLLANKAKVKNTYARKLGNNIILYNKNTGEEVEIASASDFAKEKCPKLPGPFAVAIRRVIRKEQKEYLGWQLK